MPNDIIIVSIIISALFLWGAIILIQEMLRMKKKRNLKIIAIVIFIAASIGTTTKTISDLYRKCQWRVDSVTFLNLNKDWSYLTEEEEQYTFNWYGSNYIIENNEKTQVVVNIDDGLKNPYVIKKSRWGLKEQEWLYIYTFYVPSVYVPKEG